LQRAIESWLKKVRTVHFEARRTVSL